MYVQHQNHFWGLFTHPKCEWRSISHEKNDILHLQLGLMKLAVLAAVPAISFFLGMTQVGWSFSGVKFNQISLADGYVMAIGFYLSIYLATLLMAYFTYLAEKTFATKTNFANCLLFVSYTATPMYISGIIGLIPIVWLTLLVLISAVCYSLYLLYLGIPIYMDIEEGKGFIVSTSIVTAGLCTLVFFLITTVSIWSMRI